MNERTNGRMNEWKGEWMKRMKGMKGMNEGMNEWMNEWMSEWMNERNEWMNKWMNEWTNWLNDWMNACMNAWMNEWMNDWMNEWMHEWMSEWMNQSINPSINEICRPHLPKVLRTWQFFKKVFMWNWALATGLGTFCRQLLQIEARNGGNRSPTSATAEATLPEKTQGFAPENLFKPEFTRSRPVTLPNYLMMMWLTSWCVWDDGENLPVTIVRNSEVSWLNFLWQLQLHYIPLHYAN